MNLLRKSPTYWAFSLFAIFKVREYGIFEYVSFGLRLKLTQGGTL